jgi:hypothetical protein
MRESPETLRERRRRSLHTASFLGAALLLVAVQVGAASERLLFVKGRTIMTSTLDSMIVLPGGDIVQAADLYMGFSHVAFVENDVLVHNVTRDTFSTYRDSEYLQSGILENAGLLELFAQIPPSPAAMSLFQYVATYGETTLDEILDQRGAVVLYDLGFPTSPQPPSPDTTPPTLNLPANFTVSSLSADGAVVTYLVSASDNADPAPVASCDPPSGSLFPVGLTIVDCVARDRSGNSSEGFFEVTVALLPLPAIADLTARARPGSVTLVWSPMNGAASYNVYRRVGAGPFAPIAVGHHTDYATYPDSGLANGLTYTYAVTWVNDEGRESPLSNQASATPTLRTR